MSNVDRLIAVTLHIKEREKNSAHCGRQQWTTSFFFLCSIVNVTKHCENTHRLGDFVSMPRYSTGECPISFSNRLGAHQLSACQTLQRSFFGISFTSPRPRDICRFAYTELNDSSFLAACLISIVIVFLPVEKKRRISLRVVNEVS